LKAAEVLVARFRTQKAHRSEDTPARTPPHSSAVVPQPGIA
jgi:hypothetical protein